MPFDPDQYLATKAGGAPQFDPDAFLSKRGGGTAIAEPEPRMNFQAPEVVSEAPESGVVPLSKQTPEMQGLLRQAYQTRIGQDGRDLTQRPIPQGPENAPPQFKGEEFLTNPIFNPPGALLKSSVEGVRAGGEQIASSIEEANRLSEKDQNAQAFATATLGTAAGALKAGFGAATPFLPELAAFTAGGELAAQVPSEGFQKGLQTIQAPIQTLLDPKTLAGKSAAEIGDLLYFALAAKGVHQLTASSIRNKITNGEPLAPGQMNILRQQDPALAKAVEAKQVEKPAETPTPETPQGIPEPPNAQAPEVEAQSVQPATIAQPEGEVKTEPIQQPIAEAQKTPEAQVPPTEPTKPPEIARPGASTEAKEPWQMTRPEIEAQYPLVKGGTVDGRTVREHIPNTSSIRASIENPTELDGVREVPMSHFDAPPIVNAKTKALAEEIRKSREVNPLIVAIDEKGPYIVEGANRYDAMKILGAKSIPAKVVLDEDALYEGAKKALAEGKPVPPEVLKDYPDLAKQATAETKPASLVQDYVALQRKALPDESVSGFTRYAEHFIAPIEKKLVDGKFKPIEAFQNIPVWRGRGVGKELHKLVEAGLIDVAWDKDGAAYYARKGSAVPKDLTKDFSKEAAVAKPEDVSPYYVTLAGKKYPIQNLEEASRKFSALRDKTGSGVTRMSEAGLESLPVFDQSGKQVAHVAYNGKVFEGKGEDWNTDTKKLFDPYAKGEYAEPNGPTSDEIKAQIEAEDKAKQEKPVGGVALNPITPKPVVKKEFLGEFHDANGNYIGDLHKTGDNEYRIRDVNNGKITAESGPLTKDQFESHGGYQVSASQRVNIYRPAQAAIPPSARRDVIAKLGGPDVMTGNGPLGKLSDRDLIDYVKEQEASPEKPTAKPPQEIPEELKGRIEYQGKGSNGNHEYMITDENSPANHANITLEPGQDLVARVKAKEADFAKPTEEPKPATIPPTQEEGWKPYTAPGKEAPAPYLSKALAEKRVAKLQAEGRDARVVPWSEKSKSFKVEYREKATPEAVKVAEFSDGKGKIFIKGNAEPVKAPKVVAPQLPEGAGGATPLGAKPEAKLVAEKEWQTSAREDTRDTVERFKDTAENDAEVQDKIDDLIGATEQSLENAQAQVKRSVKGRDVADWTIRVQSLEAKLDELKKARGPEPTEAEKNQRQIDRYYSEIESLREQQRRIQQQKGLSKRERADAFDQTTGRINDLKDEIEGLRKKAAVATPAKSEGNVKVLPTREIPIEDISTEPSRFQPRVKGLDEEHLKSMIEGFQRFKTEANPVKVWRDPADGKLKMLVGHHRLELFKRMGEKSIPGAELSGPEKEVVEYAHKEQVEAKAQTITDRANYYRIQRESGKTKSDIEKEASQLEGRNAATAISLSYLNPKGKAIDTIEGMGGEGTEGGRQALTLAKWIGEVRRIHPELSDSHESEIYDYLGKNYRELGKGFRSESQFKDFIDAVVDKRTTMGEFEADKPLNLNDLIPRSQQEIEYDQRIDDARKEWKDAKEVERQKRKEFIDRGASDTDLARVMEPYAAMSARLERDLNNLVLGREGAIGEIRSQEMNLFDQIDNAEKELSDAGVSKETIDKIRSEDHTDAELDRFAEEARPAEKVQGETGRQAKPEVKRVAPVTSKETYRQALVDKAGYSPEEADVHSVLQDARAATAAKWEGIRSGIPLSEQVKGTMFEAEKPKEEGLFEKSSEKQPWQMTADEWQSEKDKMRPNAQGTGGGGYQTNIGKSVKGAERAGQAMVDRLTFLNSGIKKVDPETKMAEQVTHYDVVKKAISEGREIPSAVLKEYPELSNKQEVGPVASKKASPGIKPPKTKQLESAGTLAANIIPYGQQFAEQDVVPAFQKAIKNISQGADAIRQVFAPASRGEEAQATAAITRVRAAQLARRKEVAYEALNVARKAFNGMPERANLDFINQVETGAAIVDPKQRAAAQSMREMLQGRWAQIQKIKGTDAYIENYFPHIWDDPENASKVIAKTYSKRPMEGSKAYLKERTIPTVAEGLEKGLKLVSSNPVDLVLARVHDMDKFVMAHRLMHDLKEHDLSKYVSVFDKAPDGWKKIDDKVATVFGNPEIPVSEYVDQVKYNKLNEIANSFGLEHERKMKIGGQRLGYAKKPDEIKTKFATPLGVLTHEIGHHLDWKFNLWSKMIEPAPKEEYTYKRGEKAGQTVTRSAKQEQDIVDARKQIQTEIRALADMRVEGMTEVPKSHMQYLHKAEEKIANMIDAYVNAPERFQKVAPTLYGKFDKFVDEHPELQPLRDVTDSLTRMKMTHSVNAGGIVIRGNYYFPEQTALILNNYLSPGLANHPIAGPVFRSARGVGNFMNQVQLGLSAFHLAFTANDSAISKAALGIQQAMDGRPFDAAKTFAAVPIAPIENYVRGNKIVSDYFKRNPDDAEMVNAIIRGGGRVKMDSFYRNSSVEGFWKAFHNQNPLGMAIRTPGAIIEAAAKPIMEWIVPRQKVGVFADMAKDILAEENSGKLSHTDATLRLQEAWDSVDNRMGQLVYDNLFWNRAVKDLGLASVRSLGWNLGTIREIGGGIADTGGMMVKLASGKQVRMTPRMAYIIALPVVMGLQGAMLGYMMTGKKPEELKDYFFPKTGKKNPEGTDERVSLPSYMKDVYAYAEKPLLTISHKMHPLISAVAQMLDNRDYYGTQIRNEDDPLVEQVKQEADFWSKQFVPFAVRNMQTRKESGGSAVEGLESFVGVTPAPRYLDQTPAEKMMRAMMEKRGQGTTSLEDAKVKKFKNDFVNKIRLGTITQDDVKEAVRVGAMLPNGEYSRDVKWKLQTTSGERMFRALTAQEAAKVYSAMSPQEKARYSELYVKKIQNYTNKAVHQ